MQRWIEAERAGADGSERQLQRSAAEFEQSLQVVADRPIESKHRVAERMAAVAQDRKALKGRPQTGGSVVRKSEIADACVDGRALQRQRQPGSVARRIGQAVAMHPSAARELHAVEQGDAVGGRE